MELIEQLNVVSTTAKRTGFVQAQNEIIIIIMREVHNSNSIEIKELLIKIGEEVFAL